MISNSGPVGIAVLILLCISSIWVWIVILSKITTLGKYYHLSEQFLSYFWEAKSLSEFNTKAKDMSYSPLREVFRSGFNEMIRVLQVREKKNAQHVSMSFETIKRAISKQKMLEESFLSTQMNMLAVCASAAPFIGLFGTVVGVIRAFHDIGVSGASSLATVAPGVSESLISTALGLFVAIPAVIFYNIITSKIKKHLILLDGFSADFINILERHYSFIGVQKDVLSREISTQTSI